MNKLLLILIWLASLTMTEAQEFHYETNIVKVPCKMFFYYAIKPDGEIIRIASIPDHDVNFMERSIHENPPFTTIFRVNSPLDGVATVRHEGPRTVKLPVAMPPLPVPLVKSLIVAQPMPPIGIAHRFHDGQLSGVQAWMTNGTTNAWIFQVSTNLLDWNQAGNEQVWPDWTGVRMTETGIQGQTFIRAHKL